ncbi:hypothetical protein FRB97_006615 [Tulasnella sp. 331]|nr:hypothetical protein FRB97_006615 [Tulasnella sp. 331]
MSQPTASSSVSPPPAQTTAFNPYSTQMHGFSLGPGYILGFFGVLGVLFTLGIASAWRGIIIRRRRQALGLPDEVHPRPTPEEIQANPPMMHSTHLMQGSFHDDHDAKDGKVASSWANIFPLSSSIIMRKEADLLSKTDSAVDAHLDPSLLAALAEILLMPLPFLRRHRKPEDKNKMIEKEASQSEKGAGRLVTSVLIAMPSAKQRYRWRESSSLEEDGQLPEFLLGISDEEVPWVLEKIKDLS